MPFHSPGWIDRQLHKIDQLDGTENGREGASLGLFAGFVIGSLFGSVGAASIVRMLLERCPG